MSGDQKREGSDFGRGLAYSLGLFLAHERDLRHWAEIHERGFKKPDGSEPVMSLEAALQMALYAAKDHAFELQWPSAPPMLQPRLKAWQEAVLKAGDCMGKGVTHDDAFALFTEAKNLLLALDLANGVNAQKATWE